LISGITASGGWGNIVVGIQGTKMLVVDTWWELRIKLAEVKPE
jgi:hypothetical protein